MQGIGISSLLFLFKLSPFFLHYFAAILSSVEHNLFFVCLRSPFRLPDILFLFLRRATGGILVFFNFCLCSFVVWCLIKVNNTLRCLSWLAFQQRFLQFIKHQIILILVVCLFESSSPLWFLKVICFHFYWNSFSHHDLQSLGLQCRGQHVWNVVSCACVCFCVYYNTSAQVCWCLTLPWQAHFGRCFFE